MKITEALKKVYLALGGSDAFDESDIATGIEQISTVSSGGSSSLPEVTSDDNGDVLTVVEGAWAKAQPSGGGLVCRLQEQDLGEQGIRRYFDKSVAEIVDAMNNGQAVYVYQSNEQQQIQSYDLLFAVYMQSDGSWMTYVESDDYTAATINDCFERMT